MKNRIIWLGGSAPKPPGFIALGQNGQRGRPFERPPIPAADGARVASLRGSILRQLTSVYQGKNWSPEPVGSKLSLILLSQSWGAVQSPFSPFARPVLRDHAKGKEVTVPEFPK